MGFKPSWNNTQTARAYRSGKLYLSFFFQTIAVTYVISLLSYLVVLQIFLLSPLLSPNRYNLLFVSRMSLLHSASSCQELTSAASFMLRPCFALKSTGQSPSIASSFKHSYYVRSNVTNTSTVSLTYLKWKQRWSKSLCCNYLRGGSGIGCMQRNRTTFIGRQGDFLIILWLI